MGPSIKIGMHQLQLQIGVGPGRESRFWQVAGWGRKSHHNCSTHACMPDCMPCCPTLDPWQSYLTATTVLHGHTCRTAWSCYLSMVPLQRGRWSAVLQKSKGLGGGRFLGSHGAAQGPEWWKAGIDATAQGRCGGRWGRMRRCEAGVVEDDDGRGDERLEW